MELRITTTMRQLLTRMAAGDVLIGRSLGSKRYAHETVGLLVRHRLIARQQGDGELVDAPDRYVITQRGRTFAAKPTSQLYKPTARQHAILTAVEAGQPIVWRQHLGCYAFFQGDVMIQPATVEALRSQGLIQKINNSRASTTLGNGFVLSEAGHNLLSDVSSQSSTQQHATDP